MSANDMAILLNYYGAKARDLPDGVSPPLLRSSEVVLCLSYS